ncbi:MAG: SpoVG family protein [Eubacterium sp.]
MLLTQIRIKRLLNSQTKLKGYAFLIFDEQLAVHDIKILQMEEKLFLAMPSRKKKSGDGFNDIVHPINSEMRGVLERILFMAYEYCECEKYSNLLLKIAEDCGKTNVYEQDISDFKVLTQYREEYIDLNLDKYEKDQEQEQEQEHIVEQTETKTFPIFNYIPGVIFIKQRTQDNRMSNKEVWKKINMAGITRTITDSDFAILKWIEKMEYATSKNIFMLMSAGVIKKSPNYVFEEKKVKQRLSKTLAKTFQLIETYKFLNTQINQESSINIYILSSIGVNLLRGLNIEANTRTKLLSLQHISEVKKILALNQWFCQMLFYYKEDVSQYDLNVVMDTENSIDGRGNVKGYINVNNQAFFAESFRRKPSETGVEENQTYNKIKRLCILAEDYDNLTINLRSMNLVRQPVIVIVGENEDHCKELENIFCEIKSKVKIIYTYDTILCDNIEKAYFEFRNNKMVPYDVNALIYKNE